MLYNKIKTVKAQPNQPKMVRIFLGINNKPRKINIKTRVHKKIKISHAKYVSGSGNLFNNLK